MDFHVVTIPERGSAKTHATHVSMGGLAAAKEAAEAEFEDGRDAPFRAKWRTRQVNNRRQYILDLHYDKGGIRPEAALIDAIDMTDEIVDLPSETMKALNDLHDEGDFCDLVLSGQEVPEGRTIPPSFQPAMLAREANKGAAIQAAVAHELVKHREHISQLSDTWGAAVAEVIKECDDTVPVMPVLYVLFKQIEILRRCAGAERPDQARGSWQPLVTAIQEIVSADIDAFEEERGGPPRPSQQPPGVPT